MVKYAANGEQSFKTYYYKFLTPIFITMVTTTILVRHYNVQHYVVLTNMITVLKKWYKLLPNLLLMSTHTIL